jgi:membrane-associated protein
VSFLQGLHGAVALALLTGLLFAEEAGVPLPFAPGELTLLVAGLLIASGGLNPFVFVPLALVACIAGSLVGYSWARVVGDRGLRSLAKRLRQLRNLERVEARILSTGWLGIAVTRLIPGLRIYTTLVAGAIRAPRRSFILAMALSTVVWVGAYVALGILVGVPVERFLNQVQKLALQGAILIAMGVGCYVAVRKTPASSGAGLVRVPRWIRVVLAAALDVGVVASVITGLLALGRLLGVGLGAGWIDAVVALLVVGAFYVIVARRSGGATVGEALLQTSYISGKRVPLRPRAAMEAVRSLVAGSNDEFSATCNLLRALSDPDRLKVAVQLLDGPRTLLELATNAGVTPFEVRHLLGRLETSGVVDVKNDEPDTRYDIRSDLRPALVQLLAAMHPTLAAAATHGPSLPPRPEDS